MTDKICIHCVISGHVQGVWFRASTRDEALRLGLTGWVRNLPEGEVEVIACGPENQIKMLHQWLHEGPRLATVHEVTYEELPWQEHHDFTIR